jgi:hypothetical protein
MIKLTKTMQNSLQDTTRQLELDRLINASYLQKLSGTLQANIMTTIIKLVKAKRYQIQEILSSIISNFPDYNS